MAQCNDYWGGRKWFCKFSEDGRLCVCRVLLLHGGGDGGVSGRSVIWARPQVYASLPDVMHAAVVLSSTLHVQRAPVVKRVLVASLCQLNGHGPFR